MGVQYDVGRYLLQSTPRGVYTGPERGALVFVETRDDFFGPLVVRAARGAFPEWPTYVFATPEVLARFSGDVRKIEISPVRSPQEFSKMMFAKAFWGLFPESHVLLVQSDAVVVRGCRPEHFAFDFIGAVCGTTHPNEFLINGGLSLRRPRAMLRALDLMTPDDLAQPEDVAFTRVLRRSGGALPTVEQCNDFAIESIGNPRAAIGAHGTDKYYAPADLLRALVA